VTGFNPDIRDPSGVNRLSAGLSSGSAGTGAGRDAVLTLDFSTDPGASSRPDGHFAPHRL